MTRYLGSPLKAENETQIVKSFQEKTPPEQTTRYKVWKIITSSKTGMTAKEIETKLGKTVATRTFLRLLEELAATKQVKRYKCRCGCSYIYYP